MKVRLVDLLPKGAEIELEDVGELFWRYCQQAPCTPPAVHARDWLNEMADIAGDMGHDVPLLGQSLSAKMGGETT